jgi:DNA-binding transcriptional LysR family regulator
VRTIDLNRVAAFVRVVQDGGFTKAARSLGVPKSSVSRSVAQLEEELGIRLLQRTTRQVQPTGAGTAFYERVARAIGDIDEATAAASDMHVQLRGTVRLTAPPDLGTWVLAPALARFVRKNPAIQVDVALTGRVVDLVAEGFDLAVRAGPLRDSSLVARRIGGLGSALYASPRYLARRGTPERVEDLASHDAVLFRPLAGRWPLARGVAETREVSVTGPLTGDDLAFVRKAVLAGAGISMLPEFLCARDEQRGKLVRVLPEWRFDGSPLHVVYASARFVPQRVVVVREYLVERLTGIVRACDRVRGKSGERERAPPASPA